MSSGDAIRTTSSRQVFANQWLTLREDGIEYPDGTAGTYTVVDKRDFALVIPCADDGFWLVQQFRYTVGSREWEFPQGGWPNGGDGTQEELARTELAQETGFGAGSMTHLGRLFAAYGFSGQSYDIFLATDLEPGAPEREQTESDMVHSWFTEAEVRAMIRRGELRDSHSVAALALYDLYAAG